jgi:hypothetical protein
MRDGDVLGCSKTAASIEARVESGTTGVKVNARIGSVKLAVRRRELARAG